ncbi:hypothetical protein PR048_009585 [Dryococelus australis]|uniref:Uncharacterized protein n=1 Tax=Dryococelus australis TaxID=614101 RepID=A0ABQ9I240_9NEOP|nr:hypothetical protein PR048_009585 [Dryococelus australis]
MTKYIPGSPGAAFSDAVSTCLPALFACRRTGLLVVSPRLAPPSPATAFTSALYRLFTCRLFPCWTLLHPSVLWTNSSISLHVDPGYSTNTRRVTFRWLGAVDLIKCSAVRTAKHRAGLVRGSGAHPNFEFVFSAFHNFRVTPLQKETCPLSPTRDISGDHGLHAEFKESSQNLENAGDKKLTNNDNRSNQCYEFETDWRHLEQRTEHITHKLTCIPEVKREHAFFRLTSRHDLQPKSLMAKVAWTLIVPWVLHRHGYIGRVTRKRPHISKTNHTARQLFAKEHVNKFSEILNKVISSDETKINLYGSDSIRSFEPRWCNRALAMNYQWHSSTVSSSAWPVQSSAGRDVVHSTCRRWDATPCVCVGGGGGLVEPGDPCSHTARLVWDFIQSPITSVPSTLDQLPNPSSTLQRRRPSRCPAGAGKESCTDGLCQGTIPAFAWSGFGKPFPHWHSNTGPLECESRSLPLLHVAWFFYTRTGDLLRKLYQHGGGFEFADETTLFCPEGVDQFAIPRVGVVTAARHVIAGQVGLALIYGRRRPLRYFRVVCLTTSCAPANRIHPLLPICPTAALRVVREREIDRLIVTVKTGSVLCAFEESKLGIPESHYYRLQMLIRLAAVRLLASHLGEPVQSPGQVTSGFSQVVIVPDDADGRRIFSGISRFPRPFIPALLHT